MNTLNTLKEQPFDPEDIYKELNKGFFSNLIRSILKFFGFNQGLSVDFLFGICFKYLLDYELSQDSVKSCDKIFISTEEFLKIQDLNYVKNQQLEEIINLIVYYKDNQDKTCEFVDDFFKKEKEYELNKLLPTIIPQIKSSSNVNHDLLKFLEDLQQFIDEIKRNFSYYNGYDYRDELNRISTSDINDIKPTLSNCAGIGLSEEYIDDYRTLATAYKSWRESNTLHKASLKSKKLLLLAYVEDYLQKCPDENDDCPKREVMDYLKKCLECDINSGLIQSKINFLNSLQHSHGWGNGLFSTRVRDAVSMAYEIMKEEQFAEALDKIEESSSLQFNDSESTLVDELKGYFTEGKNYRNSHDKIAHRLQERIINSQPNNSTNNADESQLKREFWQEMNKHYTRLLLADILRYKGNTVKTSVMEKLFVYLNDKNDSNDALTALNTKLNATPDYDKGFFSQRVKTAVEAAKILKDNSNGPSLRT